MAIHTLAETAPAFVEMAHRIVWATTATVAPDGQPRTRILHPIWEWDGTALTGWIATSPQSPKRRDLDAHPVVSLTYWDPSQDTCTADCAAVWVPEEQRAQVWDRFVSGPPPVGYDPAMIPGWTGPDAEVFGALQLTPSWLRVFPGTMLLAGEGTVRTWRA